MRARRFTEKPSLCFALVGCVFAALLAGCGEEPKSPATHSEAATARPADAELAQVYDNSCKLCHANPAAGAPLTGDKKAWEPGSCRARTRCWITRSTATTACRRWACACSVREEQFLALISFMSGQHIQQ